MTLSRLCEMSIKRPHIGIAARALATPNNSRTHSTTAWKEANDEQQYQYLQQSKLRTMHFQKSLPRLPIPKLEQTCDRYLTAQRPLLIEEAYRKTEYNTYRFRDTVGTKLQQLLTEFDKHNRHTSYISEFWYDKYLRDRTPLPVHYNPMIVLHKDERVAYNDQAVRTANLIVSSLRFYKSLTSSQLEPEVYHLNPSKSDTETFRRVCKLLPEAVSWYGAYLFKAYPLDMNQYPNLFSTTRIPETDKDRIVTIPHTRHITVQYRGYFYTFQVLDERNNILPASVIYSRIKRVLSHNQSNPHPIGILTTFERNKWATIRHKLIDNGNEKVFKLIDSALFNLCLDDEDLHDDPYAVTRQFLHGDGTNRWFDKSFSLLVSKDGCAAVNFEHSWGDGVAILRYIQDIYKDTTQKASVVPETQTVDVNENDVQRLDIKLDEKTRNDIVDGVRAYKTFCKSLDIDYLIFDRIGKNVCKKQAVSPDAVMQLGFQIGYYKMCGKFVPTYESCSTAAFKHGRTETVRPCTMATKAYTLAVNGTNKADVNQLKQLIGQCSKVHSQLTREAAMGQGFDRHLFALKKFAEHTNTVCNVFDDPAYSYLNNIIISTSTLNSPAVFAGGFGPVTQNGLGVAYVIRDDSLGVLVTSYPPHQNGSDFIEALKGTFEGLVNVLQAD